MFDDFDKLRTGYMVLVFYTIIMIAAATIGYNMDKKDGFTNGYIAGIVISLVLWFNYGKQISNL